MGHLVAETGTKHDAWRHKSVLNAAPGGINWNCTSVIANNKTVGFASTKEVSHTTQLHYT